MKTSKPNTCSSACTFNSLICCLALSFLMMGGYLNAQSTIECPSGGIVSCAAEATPGTATFTARDTIQLVSDDDIFYGTLDTESYGDNTALVFPDPGIPTGTTISGVELRLFYRIEGNSCEEDIDIRVTDPSGSVTEFLSPIPGCAGNDNNALYSISEMFVPTGLGVNAGDWVIEMKDSDDQNPMGAGSPGNNSPAGTEFSVRFGDVRYFTERIEQVTSLPSGPIITNGLPDCPGTNYTYTYEATAPNGTVVSCDQVFTIDNADPTISCPVGAAVSCFADISVDADDAAFTTSCDLGADVSVSDPAINGDADCPGTTYTYTYTVEDACGRTASCDQVFTIAASNLMVTCPMDVAGLTCRDALPIAEVTLPGSSNCDPAADLTVTAVVDSDLPTSFCTGDNLEVTRTYTVEDACGNQAQCIQTFTFDADVEGPVIATCPADATLTCGDALPPSVLVLFGTDNCDTPIEFAVTNVTDGTLPTSFCTGDNLEVTRTYTIADACGNESECVQTFTFVADTEGPTVTCPADDATLVCGDDLPVAETMLPGTDNCDTATMFAVTDVTDDALPTSFCTGDNLVVTRTYTVEDACGNEGTCVQTFTFVADTEGPTVTCPPDVTLTCVDDLPVAETMLPGTDNCDTATMFAVTDVTDDTLPTSFCTGDNLVVTRTYTVEDTCGNEGTCVQTFTFVADTEGPTVTCPPDDATLVCGDDLPVAETMLPGTDNCDTATMFAVTNVTDDTLPTSFCTGDNLVVTRTYTVEDACGNEGSCVQTFTFVADTDGPTVTCPPDVTLTCVDDLPVAETMLSGTDNCDVATEFMVIAVVDSDLPADFCAGSNLAIARIYTVADACGNETQCSQTFRFAEDTEVPQIDCPANVGGLTCSDDLPAPDINVIIATDNCTADADIIIEHVGDSPDPSTFSFCMEDGPFIVTRTYRATDACGLFTECTQTFTFEEDNTPPSISCPANPAVVFACNDALPAPDISLVNATDNCTAAADIVITHLGDNPNLDSILLCPGPDSFYQIRRTYRAADACGNTSTCVQIFTFAADEEPPVVTCPADVSNLVCGDVLPLAETMLPGTDNCDPATEFMVVAVDDGDLPTSFCAGDNLEVTRTYNVEDNCGNETQCIQTFTFLPNDTPPIVVCPEDCPVACASDIRPGTPEYTTSCGTTATVSLSDPVIDGDPGCDGTTYTYTHTVTDECGLATSCDQVFTIVNECHLIDFDFDDEGNPLPPGTDMFDQYNDFTITTDNPHRCVQLFDTGNPTSNDFDLGTPNEQYGGPGIGAGGDNNTDFQGNALIVSKDCGVPNETEGQLIFTFDCSVTIKTVDLLDMKCGHSEIELYDEHHNLIEELPIPGYGVNSFNTFDVFVSGVYTMIIDLDCGGGVTAFKYCKDNAPGTDCEAPDLCENYNLDFDNSGYHWTTNSMSGSFDVDDQNYTINILDDDGILEDTYENDGGLLIGIDPHDVDDEVVVCYNLSQVSDNVSFDIFDLDYKDGNSKQQEAVCVYGLLGDDPTQILPTITSLDGNVDIDGNCAEATTNSAQSHDDESVLVEFDECIDKVVIVYGTGSNSPTANPSYSKITIGESIGFNSEVCPGDCVDCVVGSSGGDDDGDGVCNVDDVCPGGDDNIDSDDDGIPDACDDICYDYNIHHGNCGAGWQHGDESGTVELGTENISINILDDDNILENTEADGEGLLVGIDPHTVDDELIVCYTLSESSANVVFDITDLDYKNSGSKQHEAVCVYATLGSNPTQILPTITSLDGSVDIDGNCAEGTVNSAHSHDDESILVEFTECIDKITIVYGTGSNSPTHDPSYSKITIGESIFSVEQCKGGCDEPCAVAGSGGGDGDADDDGVCDGEDICPGGDDFMDTDGDGTPDFCDDDCTAGSSPVGDDDGDFVCNDVDQCPGFDDNIDENNNGIPDACDVECENYTLDLAEHGYDWSGHSLMESYTVGNQTFDVRIIDGDGILTSSHDRESGLAIGTNPHDVNDEVVVCYSLSQVASNVMFDIVDLDYKTGGSRQQEAVCVYGTLGNDATQIMPNITSLDGSVAIDGNCAEATANSSASGQDESILVEFTECIDKVTIIYGTGSNSPTHNPDHGKITIGQDLGFVTEVCTNTCPEPRIEDEENAHISLYPNPVYGSSNVTIEIDTEARGDAEVVLIDALGRIISSENIQLVNDLTIHQFSTKSLAAGVYFVQLQTQEWRTDGLKLVVVKP